MKTLYNARIYTLDLEQHLASALVINQERIEAVGGEELLNEFNHNNIQDMEEEVILPGLIDAHMHLQEYALSKKLIDCDAQTKEECLHRVADSASKANSGQWLRGHGWNQNDWGGIWPTVEDLDRIAPENLIYLSAKSLHAAWVNTCALRLAGIEASTVNPKDSQVLRNEKGQPTGILLEKAVDLVREIIPKPDIESLVDDLEQVQTELWKKGVTGVHDFDQYPCYLALQRMQAREKLRLRVVKNIHFEDLPQAVVEGWQTGSGDNFLRIGSIKMFADGALGPHTAAMFEPYSNNQQNRGILNLDHEDLFEKGRLAVNNGFSVAVHAIRDCAVHKVLNGFSHLRDYEQKHDLPHRRHRLEHVQLINPDDGARIASLDLIASMQPAHVFSDMFLADQSWGIRAAFSYAWRIQLNHGTRLAFGSDAPVESPNPFFGMYAAVTRRRIDGTPGLEGWYPEQCLTIQEALEGYTLGPAYAAGMENQLARIKNGYLADLIVLDNDPFQCDITELPFITSAATMVGGEWVWQE